MLINYIRYRIRAIYCIEKVLFINGGSFKIHAHLIQFEITFIGLQEVFSSKAFNLFLF